MRNPSDPSSNSRRKVRAAGVFSWDEHAFGVQLAAVGAALLAAAVLNWSEKRWPDMQEALIGTLFVLAATGSILLLSGNPHGGDHLKDLLVGQILWTTWHQLLLIGILYALVLVLWFSFGDKMRQLGFYVIFAFTVTASVQVVGVYLVFASLILPALSTRRIKGRARLWAGYAVGLVSYLLGIFISSMLDLPTGAVIVWSMALVAALAAMIIKRKVLD